MNRIFKTVWNCLRRCYVVVSERTGNNQSRSATLVTVTLALAMLNQPAFADNRSWWGTSAGETVNLGYDRWILERRTNVCEAGSVTNAYGWIDLTGWDWVENRGELNLKGANNDAWGTTTNKMSLYIGYDTDGVNNFGTINVDKISGIYQHEGQFYNKVGGITNLYGSHHIRFDYAKFYNEGTYNIFGSGSIVAGAKLNNSGVINNQGVIEAKQGINSTGSFNNRGTLNISGKSALSSLSGGGLVNFKSGTSSVTTLDQSSVHVGSNANVTATRFSSQNISNAGLLSITNLQKKTGVSYTQTGGTITVADNWFDNSTLNIRGGSLVRSDLGTNTVNLSGGTLTGSLSHGTFLTQTGGVYNGKFDEFFVLTSASADGLNVISLDSQLPEDVQTTLTELFTKYIPGHIAENIVSHASFKGGKVVFSGVRLTTTERDDLTKAFKEKIVAL